MIDTDIVSDNLIYQKQSRLIEPAFNIQIYTNIHNLETNYYFHKVHLGRRSKTSQECTTLFLVVGFLFRCFSFLVFHFFVFLSRHHSDQMCEGSQVSKTHYFFQNLTMATTEGW